MNDGTERWLPVPGWEGLYDVSDWGRIRSLPRPPGHLGPKTVRILKGQALKAGYRQVHLCRDGSTAMLYVHRLVMAAFAGPCPEGQEVRHLDGNPGNNRLSNLTYGTHTENAQDMVRHGHTQAGTRHYRSTLTDQDVAAIRVAWREGDRGAVLAARYGISRAAICRIVRGRAYRDGNEMDQPLGTCRICGSGFGADRLARVYCSQRCARRGASQAALEARRAARAGATCEGCGGTFDKTTSRQRYCTSACRWKTLKDRTISD
jgi:HNH endonuclease/NUMOD4 motif